ncbi:MAG: excinuclease ABC subunit UvrA, partial [Myxococcales bacterium]|nr:excinuclease ABC subunit UvrA [Myxococcales bacterium]
GQRRYVESLSAYARQFLDRLDKPKYDTIRGLSPTISIEQKTASNNPRSTVGTITELADYLRVLFARVGEQHCHQCGRRVSGQTAQQIAHEIVAHRPGGRALLLAPLLVNRKGEFRELLEDARRRGDVRLRIDGEVVRSEGLEALDKRKKHFVEAVIDRIKLDKGSLSRITESVELALQRGEGSLIVAFEGETDDVIFSEKLACTRCGISFPELTPQGFSFNSPQGSCDECHGLGSLMTIDPALVVPDDSLSIDDGAIAPWGPDVSTKTNWAHGFRGQMVKHLNIPCNKPWRKLSEAQRERLLYGTGDKKYRVTWSGKSGKGHFDMAWEGLVPRLMRRFQATKSERAKRWYAQYMGEARCPTCRGARLRPESAAVKVADASLVDISAMTVADARAFFRDIDLRGANAEIAAEVLKEIRSRLDFLDAVGLGYLSLDRAGPTLSGGESQRIRLASQVGSELTGVIYILDEPSIGL